MNKRRRRRPSASLPRLILLLVAALAMILLIVLIGRGLLGLLNAFHSDGGATERDPMFAEEAEQVTPPPGLYDDGAPADRGDDPSQNWTYEELTPVDKTAEELATELE